MTTGRSPTEEDAGLPRESDPVLETVLEQVRDGVARLRSVERGAETALAWASLNPAAETLLGCKAEALVGRPLRDMPCGLSKDLLDSLAALSDVGEPLELEHTPEATGRTLSIRANAVEGGVLIVLADKTREGGGEISAGELANNLSYALRAPLTTVIGVSEILQEGHFGPLTDRQRQYLGDINLAGRRLLAVANDVLDMSRIEAGQAELNLESLDVTTLVRGALAIVGERAAKKDIRISAELPDGMPLLLADERKLKQMLYNYLDNAVNFTPEGGSIRVRVEVASREMRFEVEDNGFGIARADLPKLFRPFSPLDGSASRRFEGTGLGLSLVKLLAELHGGTVWVKSDPGHGSTFGFSVPIRPLESMG